MRVVGRKPAVRKGVSALACAGLAASLAVWGAGTAQAAPAPAPVALPTPTPAGEIAPGIPAVDVQDVSNLDDLTWSDFKPVPNTDWANPAVEPTVKKWKAAIVLLDYPDQPFQVTQPQGSNIWGNPGANGHDIPRDQIPEFYKSLLNTPSEINSFHTLNEYWMEDSGGRYGVEITAYGPYRLPFNQYQYHYASYGNSGTDPTTKCPAALACNKNLRTDGLTAWKAGTGSANPAAGFDNTFYIGAGEDQSSVWLEFGRAMFPTKEDVPDAFGPPQAWKDAVLAATGSPAPNWAPTRYVPWTSWAAAASLWANASGTTSIESEGDGRATYAHEFSHNLGIADNYGNPYAVNPLRDQSGVWDMMSRGSFNGPGGPHQRWHIPQELGDQMGAQHMLRDKLAVNLVDPASVVNVKRSDVKSNGGMLVTSVTAREVQLPGQNVGVNVQLDGGDLSTCASQGAGGADLWACDFNRATATDTSKGNYHNYTLEVVDQMGQDSYTSDHGVLLAKTKNSGSPNKWVIDANPADIDLIDYYLADGTPVKLTRGDHRQLNDALFHAGTGSGSLFEYTDAANMLQFYVLNQHRDADGILSYDLAVRSTDGPSSLERGVALGAPVVSGVTSGSVAACTVPLSNTGAVGSSDLYSSDVYRLSASVAGDGWSAVLPQQVVAAKAGGDAVSAVVYAVRDAGGAASGSVSLTATSESDATKTATVACAVTAADTAAPGDGVEIIEASVTGSPLTMSVPDNQTVSLGGTTLTGVDQFVNGALNPVQVVDARGTSVGWSLTGQSSDFTAGGGTILAANFGWVPAASAVTGSLPVPPSQAPQVEPGAAVTAGSVPALGAPQGLCSSPVGHSTGSFTCQAALTLGIPATATLGTYTATLTLTLI